MNLARALRAFFSTLLGEGECYHSRVNLAQTPCYCPDCGYQVRIEWLFAHCRGCNARRLLKQTLAKGVRPLHQYCRHCGQEGFRIVKKTRIEAYELMYALSVKSTVYGSGPDADSIEVAANLFRRVSFPEATTEIVEAEIIQKSEFHGTKSAFNTSPFQWQKRQEPSRYRGTFKQTLDFNRQA